MSSSVNLHKPEADHTAADEKCCRRARGWLPASNNPAVDSYTRVGKKKNNNQASNDLNLERSSIQSGWSPEEKELKRRVAGNKQLQLKRLMFLTTIASRKITRPTQLTMLIA